MNVVESWKCLAKKKKKIENDFLVQRGTMTEGHMKYKKKRTIRRNPCGESCTTGIVLWTSNRYANHLLFWTSSQMEIEHYKISQRGRSRQWYTWQESVLSLPRVRKAENADKWRGRTSVRWATIKRRVTPQSRRRRTENNISTEFRIVRFTKVH